MWPGLLRRPKAKMLVLIRVLPRLLQYMLYASSWNCQTLKAS
jgi:hypothetical protein